MTERRLSERSIFEAAIEQGSPEARAAYLDQVCGSDAGLRQEIEALLAAHDRLGNISSPGLADSLSTTVDDPIRERPGTMIGPYRLMEQIGEGGMGLVFVAEQQQPVRRQVALKVIKPGMDSRQVVARFEAERQALALMDHANIARVFDGGLTTTDRPYFVMELVKGLPITDYCDQNQMPVRQRLELFAHVCQAVQHAHQKGIIHRDLKPSNVLVVSHDGTPVVKVIDFGVAKATGRQLTDKTIYTQPAQMVGTPLYMSPEQAGQSGLDVDTRSDIYSLGVLLYELLTGTTPFDRQRLREAAYDEIRRIIREEEPPRPSTRISTLGQAASTVSSNRRSDPRQLSRLFRGELDWIVMKALEKDRNRRYETASAFAADVQRYLRDEPVQACPPSAWYRFGKFTRRHRMGLSLAACVLALALGLTGSAAWSARQRALRLAETERSVTAALAQAETLLEEGYKQTQNPERQLATARLALAAAEKAEELLAAGVTIEELAARVQQVRAAVDAAMADGELLIELDRIRLSAAEVEKLPSQLAATYAKALRRYGIDPATPEAAAAQVRSSRIRNALLAALKDWRSRTTQVEQSGWMSVGIKASTVPEAFRQRCRLAYEQNDVPELARLSTEPALRDSELRKALEGWQRLPERAEKDQLDNLLLAAESDTGGFRMRWRTAVLRRDRAALIRLAGSPEAQSLAAAEVVQLVDDLTRERDVLVRERLVDEVRAAAVGLLRAAYERDPSDFWVNFHLGDLLEEPAEAIGYLRAALALRGDSSNVHLHLAGRMRAMGDFEGALRHNQAMVRLIPDSSVAHSRLGDSLCAMGRLDEAIAEYRAALRIRNDSVNRRNLGAALTGKGEWDAAIAEYQEAIRLEKDSPQAHNDLGYALAFKGQLDEAIAEYREALRIKPDLSVAHARLAIALAEKGLLDQAVAEYRRFQPCDPGDARAQLSRSVAVQKCNRAHALARKGRLDEAIAEYRRAIACEPKLPAEIYNDFAWLLATCPDPRLRNYPQAVESAKKAVQLAPGAGAVWNTLGVALYRSGNWKEAIAALEKSVTLRNGGDSFDWFFLAMTNRQLGEKDKARRWYDKAVRWMEKNRPADEELRRLRSEAAQVLGVEKKSD
jgi:serine/threonine protein kinase/Flp pilus assembly protein TadD